MDALTTERFGAIPYDEAHTHPGPVVRPKPSGPDTPEACAERRRVLCAALDKRQGEKR